MDASNYQSGNNQGSLSHILGMNPAIENLCSTSLN